MATQTASAEEPSRPRSGPDRQDAPTLMIHGSAVRFLDRGVLLLGPSASGKSDLALRLIDAGATLIADDQICLSRAGDGLDAQPPERLAGLIALRGMGVMRVPHSKGRLDLAVDLSPSDAAVDPLPEPGVGTWLGVRLPMISLDASLPSAVPRIRMALSAERAY